MVADKLNTWPRRTAGVPNVRDSLREDGLRWCLWCPEAAHLESYYCSDECEERHTRGATHLGTISTNPETWGPQVQPPPPPMHWAAIFTDVETASRVAREMKLFPVTMLIVSGALLFVCGLMAHACLP